MIPLKSRKVGIGFQVTWSKVKVTVAINGKKVSDQELQFHKSHSLEISSNNSSQEWDGWDGFPGHMV